MCLPGAGTYVTPSLNHAGCVITTSGVFSFSFLELASKIHVHSVNYAANLFISNAHFPVLLPTVIRSWFQIIPATLLIPIDLFLFRLVELDDTRYQSGFFSSINVGSGFSLPA